MKAAALEAEMKAKKKVFRKGIFTNTTMSASWL